MKTKVLLIGLAMVCGVGAARGQETLNLSLEEAQQYAVEHNYTMQNATLDVKKAEADRWATITTMFPQVKASFDYQNMCGYEMVMHMGPAAVSIPLNPNGTFGVTASVALTAQQIMGSVIGKISQEMSDITRKKTIQTTMSNVKSVYVSILVMEDIVKLLDSSLVNLQSIESTTQASVDAGAAEQVSADKVSVQVASLRSTINSNKRSLQMLYNTLLLQLGADVNSKLVLTTPLDNIMNVDKAAQLTMNGFNIENNYDYQTLVQSEKIAKDQVTLAWLDFTPTLSAYYQYSYKTYFGKDEGMNMTPPNVIGANISLPLWKSGTRVASIKKAKIEYREMLNSKKQAEDGLQVQYNQLCYDLITAIETYRIQKENLDVTMRVMKNVSEKFKYGHASNLEVTTASTDIITAQSNYIQAVMSVLNAQVSLENLLGDEK
ncbi:MAG: TolC family protein [Bacteroidales bacterium]|nr:TolC family protein [Bacteroidales bacterium]